MIDYLLLPVVPACLFLYFRYGSHRIDLAPDILFTFAIAVVYVPVTWIMLREVALRGLLRHCFSLTIMPVFAVVLVLLIKFLFDSSPAIAGAFSMSRGSHRGEMIFAIPICLASGALCWLWYKFLLYVQRKFFPSDAPESPSRDSS